MGYYKNYKSKGKFEYEQRAKETVQEVLRYPILEIAERGVSKETCERFGVRSGLSTEDGETVIAHYFPYYNQRGDISGFKKVDLTISKDEKGHFTTVGKVGVSCKLFGQQVAQSIKRKRKSLWFVEGEYDVLSCHEAAVESLIGTKFEGMEPFVVGLNCGTANALDSVMSNQEFVESFEKLTLGFDNDSATPHEKKKGILKGKEATEEVATALLHPETYVVQFPNEYKDPSDMLVDKKGGDLQKLFSFCTTRFVAEKIVSASDISFEDLIEPRVKGSMINVFPNLMKKIGGFRLRELITLTAPSNVGKSLVTAEFMHHLYKNGGSCGCIMLEETNKETLQRFISKDLGVNYNKFKDNPEFFADKETIQKSYDQIIESERLFFLDHFGSMQVETLMQKIRTFVLIHKVQYILLDHLSMVISGLKTNDERKTIDMVMTELAAFCASNDVCIILVNHLNRSIANDFKPPKGSENEPFWVPVTKEAMRGSASLEQLSWIVLGLEPQIMPDKSRGNVRLTVLKNRPWGYLGIADEFHIDDDTGEVVLEQHGY